MDCAYMNPSCSNCSEQPNPYEMPWMQQSPQQMMQPSSWPQQPWPAYYCPDTTPRGMEQYPVGMGYVPWQQWQQTYSLEKGLNRGTIFPDLDLPFLMGRCRRE